VSEWLKEIGCKPIGSAYAGSNPAPAMTARTIAGGKSVTPPNRLATVSSAVALIWKTSGLRCAPCRRQPRTGRRTHRRAQQKVRLLRTIRCDIYAPMSSPGCSPITFTSTHQVRQPSLKRRVGRRVCGRDTRRYSRGSGGVGLMEQQPAAHHRRGRDTHHSAAGPSCPRTVRHQQDGRKPDDDLWPRTRRTTRRRRHHDNRVARR
jgi:hypothetical protein